MAMKKVGNSQENAGSDNVLAEGFDVLYKINPLLINDISIRQFARQRVLCANLNIAFMFPSKTCLMTHDRTPHVSMKVWKANVA